MTLTCDDALQQNKSIEDTNTNIKNDYDRKVNDFNNNYRFIYLKNQVLFLLEKWFFQCFFPENSRVLYIS